VPITDFSCHHKSFRRHGRSGRGRVTIAPYSRASCLTGYQKIREIVMLKIALSLASAVTTLMLASSAHAQTALTFGSQQPSAFGTDPIIRVTVAFRTGIASSESQAVPDVKAQEAARRTIYSMAGGECAVLTEVFQAECRLGNVAIFTTPVPTPANSPSSNVLNATANYELKPRPPSSAR
jgi:hypothetical protein